MTVTRCAGSADSGLATVQNKGTETEQTVSVFFVRRFYSLRTMRMQGCTEKDRKRIAFQIQILFARSGSGRCLSARITHRSEIAKASALRHCGAFAPQIISSWRTAHHTEPSGRKTQLQALNILPQYVKQPNIHKEISCFLHTPKFFYFRMRWQIFPLLRTWHAICS
jgi:hypothetical protein